MIRMTILALPLFSAMAQDSTVFATGLQQPVGIVFTPAGNLLVSEGGTEEPLTGRVSLLDRNANRRSLLEGLPTGRGYLLRPYGPTGMALDGDTLYLLIGEGDTLAFPPPALRVNPDGPVSPIFNSILRIRFSAEVDRLRGTFRLGTPTDWALLDGYEVRLDNSLGESAIVQLLTAFRPLVRNVLGGTLTFRQSNPYFPVLDARNNTLWLTDSAMETVIKVDTITGRYQVVHRFQPIMRSTASGMIPVDTVPTGLCLQGDQLLVAQFTASLQREEEASILSIDTRSGAARMMTANLTAVSSILCTPEGIYSSEGFYTRNPVMLRLSLSQGASRRTLAEWTAPEPRAIGGMARDPVSGAIYLTRSAFGAAPGEILRVATR
jgi:hypothetical protein